MLRHVLVTITLAATLALSGCCTGPGCGPCSDCCEQPGYYAHRPLDSFRNFRRGLTCGAGCGETYYGEWRSTPPDCCEPCDFADECAPCSDCGEFCGVVGGCGIRPVRAVARLVGAIYGKRLCGQCGHAWDDCCCDEGGSGYDSYGSDCGCASCQGETVIGQSGGCANGNCYGKNSRPITPIQAARQTQVASRQKMVRPDSDSRTASTKTESGNSGVRQAQRIPQDTSALRR